MVETDWSNLDPPRRLACLFSKQRSLAIPVGIDALIREFADVEYATIPGSCDALMLSSRGTRSRIIISDTIRQSVRERFTLAHELAHLILPWQHGSVFCHTDLAYSFADYVAREIETDANRFAAELLVPTAHVQALLQQQPTAAKAIREAARSAKSSAPVAVLATVRCLPPGSFAAICDPSGRVEFIACHEDENRLRLRLPRRGDKIMHCEYETSGAVTSTERYGDRSIQVVERRTTTAGPLAPPIRGSDELLKDILLAQPLVRRANLRNRVNGVVGALYGKEGHLSRTSGEMRNGLQGRFIDRHDLDAVRQHPLFGEYLDAKAHELFIRRRS